MSSINRRRNGLMALSVIWGLLSWVRFEGPRSQDRTLASATLRDPSLATNYRESGLVLRRVSPVARRPREGPLTEPTPAVRPCRGNGSSCPTSVIAKELIRRFDPKRAVIRRSGGGLPTR